MLKAAPYLVFFHRKESGNQVLSDIAGSKYGVLVNRRLLKPTNRPDWFMLQVTDPPPNFFPIRIFTTLSSIISKGASFILPHRVRIRVCLWNNLTLQSIDLPVLELESIDCISSVLATADPNGPDCCVVLILKSKYILFCHVDNSADDDGGDGCWTHMDYPDDFFYPNGGLQTPAYAIMYNENTIIVRTHLHSNDHAVIIEIEKPKSLVIKASNMLEMPYPRALHTRYLPQLNRSHLVSSGGIQFVISVNYGGYRFWNEVISVIVYQLNHKTMCWNMLGTCPDAAFFVSGDDQALWCPMSNAEPWIRNRVYIVVQERAPPNRHFLYTYHIENNTISRSWLPSQPYWMPIPTQEEEQAEVVHQEKDYDGANGVKNNGNNGEAVSLLGMMLNADLLRSISSHLLNPVDYLNIRAANTFGRSVGSAKDWRSVLATPKSISVCPWLMIPSVVDRGVSSMVDPVSGNKYYLNTCWGCDFSGICYSSNGWLLMLNDFIPIEVIDEMRLVRVKLWLYNPITKHTVHLPDHDHSDVFMITHSANSRKCRVVGMSTIWPVFSFIELDWNHLDREYEWIQGEISGCEGISVNQTNTNPACVQGKYYYFLIGCGGCVASFDYDKVANRFHYTFHYLESPCTDPFEQRYAVVGYKNRLLAIYVGKYGQSLRVFEFDRSKVVEEWLEVHDLRNHNIYLSTATCLCKRAEFPGKGNKIYFPRFHHGHIVHYSMDTRKFYAGEGDSSVLSDYGSEEQLYSSWFEPGFTFKF